ncbi:MAG TPA: PKD domain-containing protein [Candidatus Bipolaricaulis sp.]|nr:PKD domain-containing protein [Candidatus Bipolaricaulis sp.]HRS13509.1 PKD domain-containing protein [Candidatus Bipolaricaulis sp.]HRU22061.1 PKD domain-containing protein [Candidatus Bipolaricaulis sp.]
MKRRLFVVGCALAALALGGCTPKFQAVPPEALFALRPSAGVAPLTVVCDGSLSFSENGRVVEYIWDLGDGTRALGPIVSHTYSRGGTFRVTLEVYDEQGLSSRRDGRVEVQFAPPTASFSTAPWRPGTGETIWFDASTSTSPNGAIVEYRWAFGNGDWDVGEKVGYMYWYGGAYPVTLTIVDEAGAVASVTQVIEVQGGPGCAR